VFGRLFWGAALFATLTPAAAHAAEISYALPFTTVHTLRAKANGVTYSVLVRVPPDHAGTRRVYPAIYLLDADYSFAVAVNTVDFLARRSEQPQAVVVALGYSGQYPDEQKYRLNRTRDYTPEPMVGAASPAQKASGGAAKFLRAIEREIFPLVEGTYPADPDDRTLVGHSYGGLFAAWVLQERPDLFRRYLLVSPSLWYNGEAILRREKAGTVQPLARRTFVYLAVGSRERLLNGAPMIDQLDRFAELLRARHDSGLIVGRRIFEDETHASIFPVAFSTGVRHLFGSMEGRESREMAVGTGE
jgi:predicted alpha/beta superfamily hydrolase